MPKSPSAFYQPATLPEALQLLAKPDVLPLAGGTKLLAGDVQGAVVDLQKLGLTAVTRNTHTLTIGATLPLAELTKALPDDDTSPTALLRQAITLAGPNTYRNAATLGGTIASRLPDSELLAALLVLDAVLT
ncbi:MAG: FAD binding domain-containing protein, partial [Anaerolineales bacterium]|nr:FAD binding domain-containing protein [Anaerolineales bacterium]